MGRHSAPDDVPDGQPILPGPNQGAASTATEARHARSDAVGPKSPPLARGSRGDLQLLRRRPWLRVRCAGAAVVIFLIYTTVIILLGRGDVYLVWVWIPTVLAGVVVGALLDNAHRALNRPPPDESG